MYYKPLSPRQKTAMLWWCGRDTQHFDGVICDGAVRSGKTMALAVGFLLWSMTQFDGAVFALCGRTIESLRRNLTSLLPQWLEGIFSFTEHRQENRIQVRWGEVENTYYLFGGKDESSAGLIQGITLSGVLLDEVALMPRSFVEQAVARCSVAGSRLFFSCNPEGPGHWFYREWICQAQEKNILYLHFTQADNPALTPQLRQRYRRFYRGLFYQRFVLGRWCAAGGLIYPFSREEVTANSLPPGPKSYYISLDYGTRNPCSMGLWAVVRGRTGPVALRLREYYFDSRREGRQKTDGEYYEDLCTLAGEDPIQEVVVDPSALSFITLIRQKGRFRVRPAKNQVLPGIRLVGEYLRTGKIKIHPSCADALRELENYRWEEDPGEDRPRKEEDHAMDEIRYFAATVLQRL